jgi:hypothetical protein
MKKRPYMRLMLTKQQFDYDDEVVCLFGSWIVRVEVNNLVATTNLHCMLMVLGSSCYGH